jgi:hypothetical protein
MLLNDAMLTSLFFLVIQILNCKATSHKSALEQLLLEVPESELIAPPTAARPRTGQRLPSRSRRSSVVGDSSDYIRPTRIGSESWSRFLGNPCFSGATATERAEHNVLDLVGREAEFGAMVGNALATARQLRSTMVRITKG